MDSNEAREALGTVNETHLQLADTVADVPAWRYGMPAVFAALLIGGIAFSSTAATFAAAATVVGVVTVVRSDRKRTGMFVSGYRRGATLPVTLVMLALMAALVFAAMTLRNGDFGIAPKLALAALAGLLTAGLSAYRRRIYQLELKAGAR